MSEIQFHITMVQDVITSDIIIYNTMNLFMLRASPPLRVGRYRTQHSKIHGIILLHMAACSGHVVFHVDNLMGTISGYL